jgi:hypothetical protein
MLANANVSKKLNQELKKSYFKGAVAVKTQNPGSLHRVI